MVDHAADGGNGIHRRLGVALYGFDFAAYIFSGLGCFLGQVLDFVGHYGKPLASFAGAGRFNGSVQGQQVGLLCNRRDNFNNLTNVRGGFT